jgi:hypothetical protein
MKPFGPSLLLLLTALLPLRGQQGGASIGEAGRRQIEETGQFFAIPIEVDWDHGAANGDATILRCMPLYAFKLNEAWTLTNLSIFSLADAPGGRPGSPGNPEPVPGPQTFGLSDFAHAALFGPRKKGAFHWGAGPFFGIPTATSDTLGSGKWSAGPAARFGYEGDGWLVGGLLGNRWSFAGQSDRKETNQLMGRLTFRYNLPNRWYFISNPMVTANWNAPKKERWVLPLGGGFGKTITAWNRPFNFHVQLFYNAMRPTGAPEWVLRTTFIVPLKF